MTDQLYGCPHCQHEATKSQMAAAGMWGKLSCPECGYEFYLKYHKVEKQSRAALATLKEGKLKLGGE